MTTNLEAGILAMMNFMSPPAQLVLYQRDETLLEANTRYELEAKNLATAIEKTGRLFKSDEDGKKTAALVLAIAKFESGLTKRVGNGTKRGDGGRSWCYMQLNIGSGKVYWGTPEMRTWSGVDVVKDTTKCWMAGIEAIRLSMESCKYFRGSDSLSAYTSGSCTRGEKKAHYRWLYMLHLVAKVAWGPKQSNNNG